MKEGFYFFENVRCIKAISYFDALGLSLQDEFRINKIICSIIFSGTFRVREL